MDGIDTGRPSREPAEKQDIFEGGQPANDEETSTYENSSEISKEAKIRVQLSQSVELSQAYRTLFYGLKKNHEHNVALVHPLAFLLRRVLFALVIIFMVDSKALFGSLLLLITCLLMLIFVVQEAPWEYPLINQQHFVNEIVFYFVCVGLMSFSGVLTESGASRAHGWFLIALIVALIAYNVVVILYDLVAFARMLARRYIKGHIATKARQQRIFRLKQQAS